MSGTSSEYVASRRKRKNGLKGHTSDWEGFVDIALTPDQKVYLSDLDNVDGPNLTDFLDNALAAGYKVSLSPDEKHGCVIATLTGRGEACVNAGYSLSSRGPDMEGALRVLHYKHVVICDCGDWKAQGSETNGQLSLWG